LHCAIGFRILVSIQLLCEIVCYQSMSTLKQNSILTYLGLPIIGVLLTLTTQQLFFKGNKRAEEKIKAKYDLLLKQYPFYNQVLEFSQTGKEFTCIDVNFATISKKDTVIADFPDKPECAFVIPSICINDSVHVLWTKLYTSIIEHRNEIDNSVLNCVKKLHDTPNRIPFPDWENGSSFSSVWCKKEWTDYWKQLNDSLEIMTRERLEIE
jgi:hypothetical protein